MTFSDKVEEELFANIDYFHDKIVMRPAEISNNPEVIRRLGVIAMNTALEADIFGAVNSTHVLGTKMMNGIGGSGDFTRNAYISIFSCPSTTKGGMISNIVPMVAHADHSEHSVDILVTDQGIADLRHLDPCSAHTRSSTTALIPTTVPCCSTTSSSARAARHPTRSRLHSHST